MKLRSNDLVMLLVRAIFRDNRPVTLLNVFKSAALQTVRRNNYHILYEDIY